MCACLLVVVMLGPRSTRQSRWGQSLWERWHHPSQASCCSNTAEFQKKGICSCSLLPPCTALTSHRTTLLRCV
jgi:hypothetical protein